MIKARGSSHYTSASPQTSQTRFLGLLWRVHLEHTMKAGVLPPDDDDDEGCPSAASAVAVQSTTSGGATVALLLLLLLLLLSEGDDVDADPAPFLPAAPFCFGFFFPPLPLLVVVAVAVAGGGDASATVVVVVVVVVIVKDDDEDDDDDRKGLWKALKMRSTFLSPRPGQRASSSREAAARAAKVPKLEARVELSLLFTERTQVSTSVSLAR